MSYSPLISGYQQEQETTRLNYAQCDVKVMPNPFPSAAPSIIPGISAITRIENLCKLQFQDLALKL
jgi:hypothetical protein